MPKWQTWIPVFVLLIGVAWLGLSARSWFFQGGDLAYVADPDAANYAMAAHLAVALGEIAVQRDLDPDQFCLRAPAWQANHNGCVLVRPALTGSAGRACTPYRALNGGCAAVEVRDRLFSMSEVQDLFFNRLTDVCLVGEAAADVRSSAMEIDCDAGGTSGAMRRYAPMVCVFLVDEREQPIGAPMAIWRGQVVADLWCSRWGDLVRARTDLQPADCWLGKQECNSPGPSAPARRIGAE